MTFEELLRRIHEAEKSWEIIKKDLGVDKETAGYLSGAYLVLHTPYVQASVKNLPHTIAEIVVDQPKILKQTAENSRFIELCKTVSELADELNKINPASQQRSAAEKRLQQMIQKLEAFDRGALDFDDSITIEVRFFPSMKIDIIQQVKKHPLVDASQTWMSPASIRVILA